MKLKRFDNCYSFDFKRYDFDEMDVRGVNVCELNSTNFLSLSNTSLDAPFTVKVTD